MRRAAKVDANHAAIRTAFKRMGCSVLDTFTLGRGAPDMVVSCTHGTWCVEVKDGNKSPSRRALTPDQESFHHNWKGLIYIVESVADVPGVILSACRACKEESA